MTRDEARQFVRYPEKATDKQILEAHGVILTGGMIGAGDSAKLIEIADAIGRLCTVLAKALPK